MPATISTRVPCGTAERLKELAQEEERTVSDIVNKAIEEYIRCIRFPGIAFVTGGGGRRKPKLLGGLDVWEVIFTARNHDMDVEKTAHYLRIPATTVRLAMAYYAAYPVEIDARLKRMEDLDEKPHLIHPAIRVLTVANEGYATSA